MPGIPGASPPGRVPPGLKVGFTSWVAAWAPFYWSRYGPQNFLWFCELRNFVLCMIGYPLLLYLPTQGAILALRRKSAGGDRAIPRAPDRD